MTQGIPAGSGMICYRICTASRRKFQMIKGILARSGSIYYLVRT